MSDASTQAALACHQTGVLLVEDEALLRMDMVDKLEAVGLAVFEARDAEVALDVLAARSDVQVMITDVDFVGGKLSGFDLARRVASDWPNIGIIITSGRARPTLGELPPGARFLHKPCSVQQLRGAVFAQVDRQQGGF